MELRDILPGLVGSFVGVMGWLLVGLYIQRRQFMRQARNAAKAVYFELEMNVAALTVAREHGLYTNLDRSSFERLLPELATILSAADLHAVVNAYMAHSGYRQMSSGDELPMEVRRAALTAMEAAHSRAMATLRECAFSRAEAQAVANVSHREGPRSAAPTSRTKS